MLYKSWQQAHEHAATMERVLREELEAFKIRINAGLMEAFEIEDALKAYHNAWQNELDRLELMDNETAIKEFMG